MVLSELPSYLSNQLGFDSANAALLSVLPYIALAISTYGFSELFRTLQDKYEWRTRSVRQAAQLTSFLGSGTCLLIAGFVTNPGGGLALMILTQV